MKYFFLAAIAIGISLAHAAEPRLTDGKFSINFQNTELRQVLEVIAKRSNLQLQMDPLPGATATISLNEVTAQEVLDRLAQDLQINYSVRGDQLIVTKQGGTQVGSSGGVHHYSLKYAVATEIGTKLQPMVLAPEKLVINESGNSLLFIGSNANWGRVSEAIGFLDQMPKQILIETQIVETSNQFLRNMGAKLKLKSGGGSHTVSSDNPVISGSTSLSYSGIFSGGGPSLDVQLDAAVTNGEAKVVSRPKVLTLNNKPAKIESGVEIHVKTLSTAITNPNVPVTSVSSGTPGLAAATGVTTLNAGLTINILPSVVGADMIRITASINDSQPDNSTLVDGIPNIQNNSASTSILVRNGETAVIAGLVKQTKSTTSTGVPILSDIPLIGLLFRTMSKTDNNNELVIFITPRIDDGHLEAHASMVGSNAPVTQ